jgi:hypothetical protein
MGGAGAVRGIGVGGGSGCDLHAFIWTAIAGARGALASTRTDTWTPPDLRQPQLPCSNGLKQFLAYVLSSFLLAWSPALGTLEFQELIMLLQVRACVRVCVCVCVCCDGFY